MRRRWGIAGASALGLFGLLWLGASPPRPAAPPSPATARAEVPGASVGAQTPRRAGATRPAAPSAPAKSEAWDGAAFASSLAGTEIDGALHADADGRLVVDLAVRDFFDYFLSAVGERTLEAVIAEVDRQIAARLPARAADEARRLLRDYVAYQQAQASLLSRPAAPPQAQDVAYYAQVMAEAFDELRGVRRRRFAPDVVDAFFGVEETFAAYSVEMMALKADTSLSASERQTRAAALEARLPEQVVQASKATAARGEAAEAARAAFASGASEAEVRARLDGTYSEAEADAMLAFLASEADWASRFERYLAAQTQLRAEPIGEAERAERLEALRRDYFADHEQARLTAEEAIQARAP